MAFMSIKIEGAKELEKTLLGLEPKLGKKIIRQAMKKAAKPIHAAARQMAPVVTGALRKSIKIRVMKRKKHRYGVVIGTAAKWFTGETFYGAFAEFGTKKQPAKPFLRPAFDAYHKDALKIFISEIRKGLAAITKGK